MGGGGFQGPAPPNRTRRAEQQPGPAPRAAPPAGKVRPEFPGPPLPGRAAPRSRPRAEPLLRAPPQPEEGLGRGVSGGGKGGRKDPPPPRGAAGCPLSMCGRPPAGLGARALRLAVTPTRTGRCHSGPQACRALACHPTPTPTGAPAPSGPSERRGQAPSPARVPSASLRPPASERRPLPCCLMAQGQEAPRLEGGQLALAAPERPSDVTWKLLCKEPTGTAGRGL